jgi:PAS domain S-box-containing protein
MVEHTSFQASTLDAGSAPLAGCWQLLTTHLPLDNPIARDLAECEEQFRRFWDWLFHLHPDLDGEAQRLLDAVVPPDTHGFLMLLDEDKKVLLRKATVGLPEENLDTTQLRLGEEFAGWVAQRQQPVLVPGEQELPGSVLEALEREDIVSVIGIPLEINAQMLGVITLVRSGNHPPFGSHDLWFCSIIAKGLALALHSASLYSQLENQNYFITRIMESIPSSLVVINRTLRVVSANRNFLVKTRVKERAVLGRNIKDVFPGPLVEYTQLDQKVKEIFHTGQAVDGGKLAYRAPGLPTRVYYYRLIPLKAEGAVENVMLMMDDITEREQLMEEVRRAERHLAGVAECANDLVISTDPQGQIVTWNQAAKTISGLEVEEVKGRSLLSLCAKEQRLLMAEILQSLARGESVQNIEVNLLTTDEQEVPIAWSCSTMRDDSGEIMGLVTVGRDLTERRRLETQLIQSAKMASLGVMAGGIAHELRNPLGIISASAQLLRERPNDPHLRAECAQKIHAATLRASQIIESLLKFARPGGEGMMMIDLQAVLEETFIMLAHQMTLEKVHLEKDFAPDLANVYGNPGLLQQVFTNMILNACNAMPKGGTLTVTTRSVEPGMVEIRFADIGQGIPPENLPRIFDPFFTTLPVGEGTGLGLSISYSIIQQHQGTIEVESQMGKGTTFTIQLPATRQ